MTTIAESLSADLERLAKRTWDRVLWGPRLGMSMREDGLTDENLFQLRMRHPYLNVRKFAPLEEAANGADWEWWIGSDQAGWIGLRIQAKKMRSMRYGELGHRTRSQNRVQCQVLIEETHSDAEGRALFPLYCFYNGWDHDPGWPADVKWTVGCSQPANCLTVPDVRIFGCGLAKASEVLGVLEGATDPLSARHTLPLQTPWSWLLSGGPRRSSGTTADQILEGVIDTLRLREDERQFNRYSELPEYAEATRIGWPEDASGSIAAAPATYVITADLSFTRVSDDTEDNL